MAGAGRASEKLRNYLSELTPEARGLLMAELERGLLRGDGMPQAQLLLQYLRELLAEQEPAPERIGNPVRLFFMPVEPYIVDDGPEHVHDGRLARACIQPIWDWISADLAPGECKAYAEDVTRLMLAKEPARAEQAAQALQDLVADRIEEALASISRDDRVRRQLAFRLGTPRAQADVLVFVHLLRARDALAALAARMPVRIRSFAGDQLDFVVTLLDGVLARQKELFPYALILVMGRLPAAWQLVRVAVKAAESDAADRLADTSYALAVKIVFAETERAMRQLDHDFKRGDTLAATERLKDLHDAVRGVRGEIALGSGTLWARQLAAIRAGVANLSRPELESIAGRVRRVIRIAPGRQFPHGAVVDRDEVAEVERMLAFLSACKTCASELALNEITMRVIIDLQNCLENGSRALLDVLHAAEGPELDYRQAQMDAAIRFCGRLFGIEYANLLARAADVAAKSERAAARSW